MAVAHLEPSFGRSKAIFFIAACQAGHLHQVEVDWAHQLRRRRVCTFEAGVEHIIAYAVRFCIQRVIHQLVFVLIGTYFHRAQIVQATASIHVHFSAQIAVGFRNVASSTPFCACGIINFVLLIVLTTTSSTRLKYLKSIYN